MRALLGVLLVLSVSGDDTIDGILGGSVVLPCICSERNLFEEVKWQLMEPKEQVLKFKGTTSQARDPFMNGRMKPKELVFKFNSTTSKTGDPFMNRTTILSESNSSNCSVLLTNITAEDQGPYQCSFKKNDGTYQKVFVNLNVSASYTVCQNESDLGGGRKLFQCDVRGNYRDATIQWTMDGQPVINTTTTSISHTTDTEPSPGLYHFISRLSITTNVSSNVSCDVQTNIISANVIHDCTIGADMSYGTPSEHTARIHHFLIIPFFLALGLIVIYKYLS